jgi:hypothetical protein
LILVHLCSDTETAGQSYGTQNSVGAWWSNCTNELSEQGHFHDWMGSCKWDFLYPSPVRYFSS